MLRALLLYLSESATSKKILTHLPGASRLPRRFIAGETLEEALAVVRQLNEQRLDVTLDHLGESVNDPAAAEDACRVYLNILDRIAGAGLRSHISVKLTSLGLVFDEEVCRKHVAAIAARAAAHRSFVRIDMESSAYTEATLRVFREVKAPRDVLGVVIQAYLYRSEKDVDALLAAGARIRLVKGAYHEPFQVAFPRKEDVDANFVKLMKKLLVSGGYHAIATHDPALVAATQNFAREQGIAPERYEFQLLYGIRRPLQRRLVEQGYRVRVYVPYGHQWYAYFVRRLAERPANLFFLLRNLVRR